MNKSNPKPVDPVDQGAAPPPTDPPQPLEKPDPFDPERLRISEDYVGTAGVKKLLTVIPVRKPSPQDWVRTHPQAEYRITLRIIELKDEREFYIIAPEVRDALEGLASTVTLFLIMTSTRTLTLWPVPRPGPDGRSNSAHKSALEAAEAAISRWTKIMWNNHVKAYDQFETSGRSPTPSGRTYPCRSCFASRSVTVTLRTSTTPSSGSCLVSLECSTRSEKSWSLTLSSTRLPGSGQTQLAWSPSS